MHTAHLPLHFKVGVTGDVLKKKNISVCSSELFQASTFKMWDKAAARVWYSVFYLLSLYPKETMKVLV